MSSAAIVSTSCSAWAEEPPLTVRKALDLGDSDEAECFRRVDWKLVIPCDRIPSMAETDVVMDARSDKVMKAVMATLLIVVESGISCEVTRGTAATILNIVIFCFG